MNYSNGTLVRQYSNMCLRYTYTVLESFTQENKRLYNPFQEQPWPSGCVTGSNPRGAIGGCQEGHLVQKVLMPQ